jgi:hypothetical protein
MMCIQTNKMDSDRITFTYFEAANILFSFRKKRWLFSLNFIACFEAILCGSFSTWHNTSSDCRWRSKLTRCGLWLQRYWIRSYGRPIKGGPRESALDNKLKTPYRKISGYEMLNMASKSDFFFGTWLRTETSVGLLRELWWTWGFLKRREFAAQMRRHWVVKKDSAASS